MDDGEVLDVLERVSEELGPRAALAASLVAQHEEKERYRRKLETLDRLLAKDQDQLSGKEGKGPGSLAVLDEVMRDIQRRHMEGEHYTREELIAAAANGMLGRLDPHSDYMTGKEFGEFVFDMHPEYGGIGAYVNMVDGVFTITRPIYSGPAYHAGLLSGDKIITVDGWSTLDQPMDETIKRLKGEPGTPVEIQVVRRGWTEPRTFTIHRAKIQPPTLFSERLPGGLLYIDLVRFTSDCGEIMRKTILEAEESGDLNGVVLDLRGNPGGYLSEAVQVCDVFLPAGKLVVSTRSRTEGEERYLTKEPAAVPPDLPLAILINRFSASASEIVSGALSVHGRAVTVGERSFGKGSVQNLLRLRSAPDEPFRDENHNGKPDPWEDFRDLNGNGKCDFGPRVKLTIAYYYLPDGSTIHTLRDHDGKIVKKGGVVPDVPVEVPELDIQSLRELDRLLNEGAFREYAEEIAKEDPDLAKELAVFDGGDASRYPGWEEWYQGLDTTLSEKEARRWVRRRLRAVVSDLRGKVFAGSGFFGDYEVDVQLQEAIRQVLKKDGLTVAAIPEYQQVF